MNYFQFGFKHCCSELHYLHLQDFLQDIYLGGGGLVAQSCPTLATPWTSPSGSSVHGILQARRLEWVAISFSRGPSNPGMKPGSPALQANSLPSKPPGKTLELSITI